MYQAVYLCPQVQVVESVFLQEIYTVISHQRVAQILHLVQMHLVIQQHNKNKYVKVFYLMVNIAF